MITNKRSVLSVFSIFFLFCIVFQDVSQASNNIIKKANFDSEIEVMTKRYQELGIDKDTGERLIQKVLNGELLDSQKDDISKNDVTIIHNEDGSELIVFPDGSRANVSIVSNESPIQPFGASTGTVTLECSSHTTICKGLVRYYDLIWDIKYDAYVSIFNGGTSYIDEVKNFRADAVTYTITNLGGEVIRKYTGAVNPAKARYQFKAQQKTGLYEVTRDLSVYLDQNSVVYARLEWDWLEEII